MKWIMEWSATGGDGARYTIKQIRRGVYEIAFHDASEARSTSHATSLAEAKESCEQHNKLTELHAVIFDAEPDAITEDAFF